MCLAIPGKIVDITGENPLERQARVSFGGVIKQISLAYVPEAQVGRLRDRARRLCSGTARRGGGAADLRRVPGGRASRRRGAAGLRRWRGACPAARRADALRRRVSTEDAGRRVAERIHEVTTQPWTLMEVCGGQTHAIVRFGLDRLLPKAASSSCTGRAARYASRRSRSWTRRWTIAARPEVTFCTFGDMIRVPGLARGSLSGQGAWRRRAHRVFADRCRGDCAQGAGAGGRVLCRRLRDDGAGQCDGRRTWRGSRAWPTSRCS
jgi:hypothetical protein